MAKLLNLDIENKEQAKVLQGVLSQLQQDDDWDESNVLEKALKAQKLKRYHYDKNLGTTSSKSKEESEGVVATRDASKKAKQILEGACDAPDPVSIKYIYIYIYVVFERVYLAVRY